MWAILVRLLNSVLRGSLKHILTGAGLMLVTFSIVMTAFNSAVDSLHQSMNSIPANIMTFISLAGFDYAIGIITGAIVTRITLNQQKLFLSKLEK